MFRTFERLTLDKTCITWGKLPSISHIDNNKVKNHILKNKNNLERLSSNEFEPYYQYYKQVYTKELTWLTEYIMQNYTAAFVKPLELFECVFLIQEPNQTIRTHHHQVSPNQKDNPDLSVLYSVNLGKEKTRLFFEYDKGRFKNCSDYIDLETGKFIIFNSNLNHYIEQNKNDESNLYISLHFQYVNGDNGREETDYEVKYT